MSEATAFSAETRQQHMLHELFARQQAQLAVVMRSTASERIAKLRRLHACLLRRQEEIYAALAADLRKSRTEVDISEIGVINTEIRHAIRHLRGWMLPKRVGTPLMLIGTRAEIRYEPKGLCLILSPWNFPLNLTFAPLVSAVAAGNCAILKPSESTPHCAALMKSIVAECFPPEEVCLVEGDADTAKALLALPFHHIFFTGSPAIGKHVMRAAAEHLASVTLELGGKSPVVVDESADLDTAAAKIAWLKGMNAGQICIACDYVLVQESVHDRLVEKIGEQIRRFYGETAEARQQSPDLCRLVNDRHFARVKGLLDDALRHGAQVAFGGFADAADKHLEPTILTAVPDDSGVWTEEIFGPLLPVRPFRTLDEATAFIAAGPRPLAMYIFSARRRAIETLIDETRVGGTVVNDAGIHFYHTQLPFGGVNNSGIGKCHGEAGFLEFTNARGVVYQNRIFPHTNLFHPPYGSRLSRWMLEGVKRWF